MQDASSMTKLDRDVDKMIGALVYEVDRGLVQLAKDLGVERRRTLCRCNGGPLFWLGWGMRLSSTPEHVSYALTIGLR